MAQNHCRCVHKGRQVYLYDGKWEQISVSLVTIALDTIYVVELYLVSFVPLKPVVKPLSDDGMSHALVVSFFGNSLHSLGNTALEKLVDWLLRKAFFRADKTL